MYALCILLLQKEFKTSNCSNFFAARGINTAMIILSRQIPSFYVHYKNLQPTLNTCFMYYVVKEWIRKNSVEWQCMEWSHTTKSSSNLYILNRCWWECYTRSITFQKSKLVLIFLLFKFTPSMSHNVLYNLFFICTQKLRTLFS